MDTPALRTDLRPEDLQPIIDLHGRVFAAECGWNANFKTHVAAPLIEFQRHQSRRQRIWLADSAAGVTGCIAILQASPDAAQLRWLVVTPDARGKGLGTRLLTSSLAFARDQGYAKVILWTERSLTAATRLYERAGFKKVEQKSSWKWGSNVVEERYVLKFELSPEVGP
jgi:N-acetylglutamate synthase-like GNAT family acetyltransferase